MAWVRTRAIAKVKATAICKDQIRVENMVTIMLP